MGLGGFLRGLSGKPPKLYPGEVVQWATVLSSGVTGAGMNGGVMTQRPYAVHLDADHQEVGDRRWLARQTFTDPTYMGAWRDWVTAQGSLPQPGYPEGGV